MYPILVSFQKREYSQFRYFECTRFWGFECTRFWDAEPINKSTIESIISLLRERRLNSRSNLIPYSRINFKSNLIYAPISHWLEL